MTVKLNFKKAQRNLLPDGDYPLDIVSATIVDSKSSDGVNLKLKLVPNEVIIAQFPEYETAKIQDIRSLAEESMFRITELALGAGLVSEEEAARFVGSGEDFEFDEDDLVGKTVGASVYIDDQYDPKHPSNKISAYFPYVPAEEEEAVAPKARAKK